MTTLPVHVCSGQSNMKKMVPVLRSLNSDYEFLDGAKGATSITQWQRGGELFGNLVTLTRQAIVDGHEIRALFVSQGESDTYSLQRAQAWKLNFLKFVAAFRTDTGLLGLHVIYAQLGAPWGSPHVDIVKAAQAQMQGNPTLSMVTLDHLSQDGPHYVDYVIPARLFMAVCDKVLHI